MNKITGCILFIGILMVGIAIYGMNMVSADQFNANPAMYQNADVIPARFSTTAVEQGNLNEQDDLKTNNTPPSYYGCWGRDGCW